MYERIVWALYQPLAPCLVLPIWPPPQGHTMSMLWEKRWSLKHTIWECCLQAWVKAWYFSKMPLRWLCSTEMISNLSVEHSQTYWLLLNYFKTKTSSLTYPTGFVFVVCNTAAPTDALKRKVIETKRSVPRSNFSLLYSSNCSTGTKQAIWNEKQTHRKSIRNTDLKKISKYPVLHACSPELALTCTFTSCLLSPPCSSALRLPSLKPKVVLDLSYFSHTAQ